jgi:hypothetical protein
MTTSTELWKRSREKLVLKPEQVRGVDLILNNAGARLFLHPGKGKTAVVLKAFDWYKSRGLVDHLLVLAPLRVITTSWPGQLDRWQDFEHLSYTIIHGDRKKAMTEHSDVYLMNYEGLLSKEFTPGSGMLEYFLGKGRFMLACDESTKLKNSGSRRFKVLKRLLGRFVPRVIMTGTPTPKHIEDLFAMCYVTDLGKDLGQYVTHFRSQYMQAAPNGFGYQAMPGAMERVAAKIAHSTLQLEYEEALPSQVIQRWVPFPEKAKKLYAELKDEFLTVLGDSVVMAPNSGVLYGKLKQVCQGALYHEDGTTYSEIHDAKLDDLESLLEELNGEPVLVLVAYRHDVDRIRARLGADIPYIGSGTSASSGTAFCNKFAAGELPILLGHPSSIALGVDGLQQSCNNVAWFGLSDSWEETYQANLRVVRQGSKADQVFIYQILVDCPTERATMRNVTRKEANEAEFCRLLREELGEL